MERDTFSRWLDAYGRAWVARDPAAAAELFAEEATYQETPFDEPMRGFYDLDGLWRDAPRLEVPEVEAKTDAEEPVFSWPTP